MSLIKNASPQVILLGADDKSTRQVFPSPEPIPQHCPLFYLYAKKGPTDRLLLSPGKLNAVYGAETFDTNDKYFNHQTRFLRQLGTYGNTAMVQRLVPEDAGVKANVAVYADILETKVPNYKRNSDGSYVLSPTTGKAEVDPDKPTINGFKVKFVKETFTGKVINPVSGEEEDVPEEDLGQLKIKTGTMFEYLDQEVKEIEYANCYMVNLPTIVKVGDTFPLTPLVVNNNKRFEYTYQNDTGDTIEIDAGTGVVTAVAEGTGVIQVISTQADATKPGPNSRKFEHRFQVVAADVDVKVLATSTIAGVRTELTPLNNRVTLTVTTDATTTTVESLDSTIVEATNNTYVALANGNTIIKVTNSDENKTSVISYIEVNVSGIVPNTAVTLGVGQKKFVRLANYDKVVSSTIAPVGNVGIETATGALVGIKNGAGVISYKDRKGKTVETITVTVQQAESPVVGNESATPINYPPIVIDENTIKRSVMYPIFQRRAKYQGEYYNNNGFTINSLFGTEVDAKIVSELKALPYSLSLYNRNSKLSSPSVVRSLFSEPAVVFSFKEKAINPNTEARMDFETVYKDNWYNETDQLKTLRYWEDDGLYFYRNNFDLITSNFTLAESEYVHSETATWADGNDASTLSWFDFTTDDVNELVNENQLLNPFIFKSSKNVNYFTVVASDLKSTLAPNQAVISMSSDTPIFMDGGSDGTLSNDMFEKLVVKKMEEYIDPDSEVIDLATNVESIFYDTGFSLNTKKSLVNFIMLRKDTALVLSTHDDAKGEKFDKLSDTRAIAVALNNRLKLAPESEYYGTGVCRGIIVGGTGKLRDGTVNRIPLSYEIMCKASDMMGASTGRFNSSKMFDNYPGNTVDKLIELQPAFIPNGIKPTLWNEGLVWAQPFDRVTYYFPAIQTVYDNDTSVLNNFFVMMVLCNLNKVAYRVWSEFTGTSGMSDGEFIDAVTERANMLLKDKYGGIITVIPFVTLTDEDKQRGYSWTMTFKLYGSNMRTVAVYTTEVYRTSDLEEQA